MADNEKKFEARLDQHKSDISAQVTVLVAEIVRCCICSLHIFQYRAAACKLGCELLVYLAVFISDMLLLQHMYHF